MNRKDIRTFIQEIGIVPSIRVSSADDARFAAETILQGGIPIAEIALTVPGAVQVIADLVKSAPDMIVGAGSVLDEETARRCLDAGARFLTTDGLIPEIVEFAMSGRRRCFSRSIDSDGSDCGMASRFGLCESGPVRGGWRRATTSKP